MEDKSIMAKLDLPAEHEPLYIDNVLITRRELELTTPFKAPFGRFTHLVRFYPMITFKRENGETITGIGECSPLSAPWYNYECHRTVENALEHISSSLLKEKAPVTDVISFIKRYGWINGHNIAKAGIEGAYWDAAAKLNNLPVYKLWGGSRKEVEAGISLGIESSPEALLKKLDAAVELKASRVKIKVKPGKDIEYLEIIRKNYPSLPLMADANGSYDLFSPEHKALLKEFDNYSLMMIEQPGMNDDIIDHSRELAHINTPVCLDESILHLTHARHAVELWKHYSAADRLIINIKPPRVGGYLEAIKIARFCGVNGVKAWCGGMFESALGKTANVHFSSLEEINLPGDHISIAPYFVNDIADSPEYSEGKINVPNLSGWGTANLRLD